MHTLRFVLQLVLGIALPFAIQRWDRRRLAPERQARAWNGASWASALYGFGPLSMIGWAWVTRQDAVRWWRQSPALAVLKSAGLLIAGALLATAILAAIGGVDQAIGALSGDGDEPAAPGPPVRGKSTGR